MCLGIVPISLFPSRFFSCSLGQAGEELAIMMAPSPALRLMGREVWPRFRHLSLLLGFNMAGVSCSWRGEATGEGDTGGRQKKQTNTKRNTTCLWTKELDVLGMKRLFSVLGSVDLTSSILLGIYCIHTCAGCNCSQWNLCMQGIVKQNGKKKKEKEVLDWFFSTPRYEKVTLINAA